MQSLALLSGGDVDAIAAALAELLGVWVVLVDAHGNELANAGVPDRQLAPGRLPALTNGRLTRFGDHWAITATAKGEPLGALVIGGVDDIPPADRRIVERAAVVTALVLLFRRQAAEQSRHAQAAVLHLHPNTVQHRLDRITALLGDGWQHPDQALDIQVALRLRATL